MSRFISEVLPYRDGNDLLIGYLVRPEPLIGLAPGILVVHEWWGLNDFVKRRAELLANLGYVAMAVDMYGDGRLATDYEEASRWAGEFKSDRTMMRRRIRSALRALIKTGLVDPIRAGAMGYCFGGTVCLELARGGAELAAVASFHGGLDTPIPAEPGAIRGSILILHGADDPISPMDQVLTFIDEMRNAGAEYEVVLYGGAVHSFTNPEAGLDPGTGAAYDRKADARSWDAMAVFMDSKLKRVEPGV